MSLVKLLMFTTLVFQASAQEQETFDLTVERVRMLMLKNQNGNLHIDARGVTFQSLGGKTAIHIPIKDLRTATLADAHSLRFGTYEVLKWNPVERREYVFRAQQEAPIENIAQFLAAQMLRPVIGYYPQEARYEVSGYHRRTFGGSPGMLKIGRESIQFVTKEPRASRTWLYRDIETIGIPDRTQFRVTTNQETYMIELKEGLLEAAYELAWSRIYDRDRSGK
jgi:hypothetical protein